MKMWIKTILGISLSFMCMLTCVGYAAMSGSVRVSGNIDAEPPRSLFITSITAGVSVAGGSAAVNNYIGTVANISIELGADRSSSKTLRVTIFNNTPDYYAFKGVEYNVGDYTYDNTNIIFDTVAIQLGGNGRDDLLLPGGYAIFDITFYYDEYRGYSEDLSAVLNFHFGLSGAEEGTDYESYILYFLSNKNGYGLNDAHKGHVVLDSLLDYKLLYADDSVSKGNLKHLLSGVNTDQTEDLTFIYQYVSDTMVILYTYEEKYNSSSYQGESIMAYKTTFVREAVGSEDYTDWDVISSVGGKAPISSVKTPAGTALYAIDINRWVAN